MDKLNKIGIIFLLLIQCYSCEKKTDQLVDIDEVSAWCVKGFDVLDRTPKQRIEMLKEMGFKRYGYNRGKGDISQMIKEFNLAEENNIEINSIFLWLNAKRDSVGKLSEENQGLLNNLKTLEQKPAIWVSFSNNFFENLNESQSLDIAVEMVKFIKIKADEVGCSLALYNHTGWFGNPDNQIKILEQVSQDSISIVYNFHHAHEHIDDFRTVVKKIKPYLSYVNLNGMIKDGPKILTIGKGKSEFEMIKCLKEEGFNGPWGILGHIKTEDVQKVLKRNIDGLKLLNSQYLDIEEK
ncbi:hypothetical protein [uncultured Winogradskyella sp.]|uniref:sugar phosphate isomerase/epimerase family protein n=1 Tax=uncultured Winogradskyella sp. TaxID=395353 RepID=UPI00260CDC23|nr:hypothetical protein [uncultured Winogradskyella sp.]